MKKKKKIKKSYFKVLESCWNCPVLGVDQNGTRWECMKKSNKFICWHGSSKEERDYFPDWCPLPDSEAEENFLTEEDMTI